MKYLLLFVLLNPTYECEWIKSFEFDTLGACQQAGMKMNASINGNDKWTWECNAKGDE